MSAKPDSYCAECLRSFVCPPVAQCPHCKSRQVRALNTGEAVTFRVAASDECRLSGSIGGAP